MKIKTIALSFFLSLFCLHPAMLEAVPADVAKMDEALVTIHMTHDHDEFHEYQNETLPLAEALAKDIGTGCYAQEVNVYPYLSFKGDYVFAHVKSPRLKTDQLLKRLNEDERVHTACPNWLIDLDSSTNDPGWPRLWGMRQIRAGADDSARSAWDIATGSSEILVAVMDTGVDFLHQDLSPNFRDLGGVFAASSRSSMDTDGHGTHVAGIIGAVGNNGIGVVGVNWRVGMLSLKILDNDGVGDVKNIVDALEHVAHLNDNVRRVHVLNMSFSFDNEMPPEQVESSPVYQAFKHIDDQNMTVMVAAAGNTKKELGGGTNDKPYRYPACLPLRNMITVGATDKEMRLLGSVGDTAHGSNWSPSFVHILAPGDNIWSTEPSNRYNNRTGTSMAAPHVSGAVALVASQNPTLDAAALKKIILDSSNRSINPPGIDDNGVIPGTVCSTYGFLNVRRALELVSSMPRPQRHQERRTPVRESDS